jgi:hypothetical protein
MLCTAAPAAAAAASQFVILTLECHRVKYIGLLYYQNYLQLPDAAGSLRE